MAKCATEYPKPRESRCHKWSVLDNKSLLWLRERDQHAHTQYYSSLSPLLSLSTSTCPLSPHPPLGWTTTLIETLSDFAPVLRKRACKVKSLGFGWEHKLSSPHFTSWVEWEALERFPLPPTLKAPFSHVLEGYTYLEIILRAESGKADENPGITDPGPHLSLLLPVHTPHPVHTVSISLNVLCATHKGPRTHLVFTSLPENLADSSWVLGF